MERRPASLARFVVHAVATVALFVSVATVAAQDESVAPPEPSDVAVLVRELDADAYDARERAMSNLVRAGDAAVEPLVKNLPSASREAVSRGLYVLGRLALSDDAETSERARSVIESFVSEDPDSALGRQASITLDDLDARVLKQTIERLRDLGAKIEVRLTNYGGAVREDVATVVIDDAWHGTAEDLRLVGRLGRVEQVEFRNEQVDDAALIAAASLKDLTSLTIKGAEITPAGLASLERVESLVVFRLLYCGDDGAADPIARMESVKRFDLFGTDISDKRLAELETKFRAERPDVTLDIRQGGFLGVRGASVQEGALVTDVVPGSAADKAGLQAGDVIASFDGKEVQSFEELTKGIGAFRVDQEIAFVVERSGERLKKTATLGEWE